MDKLKALIEVRKLIALGVTSMFMFLACMGHIEAKLVEYVVITVISFYFASKTKTDK